MKSFKEYLHIPRNLWLVVFFSALLHIGGLFLVIERVGVSGLVYGDANGYIELAKNIKSGAGFVTIVENVIRPEVFRAPGLPFILLPFVGSESSLVFYLFLQSLLASFFIPVLVWKITSDLFNPRVGLVAAGFAGFEPLLLFFGWFPLTEVPFVILSLFAILFLERGWKLGRISLATLSGLFFGASVYVRPGNMIIFSVALFILAIYALIREKSRFITVVFTALALFSTLFPWYVRTFHLTGELAIAGTGWRNVYTDYLASVRSLNNKTTFWDEKEQLKQEAMPRFGLSRADIGNPKYAHILRDAALKEIVASPVTVAKLQTMLYVSFFTNDGWYSYLRRLNILPNAPRSSATLAILNDGLSGVWRVLGEMKKQFFIPVVGRIYTLLAAFFALIYIFFSQKKVAYLIGFILLFSATASSVIGLGVEARLRISVLPFMFMLSAGGIVLVYEFLVKKKFKNNENIVINKISVSRSIKTVTIAVPAYNEALIIGKTIREIDRVLSEIPDIEYEIIVANNGSTDQTASEAYKSGVSKVRVLSVDGKGKGLAVRESAKITKSDVFIFCDADLSADPEIIPSMLKNIKAGADVVIGSRFLNKKIVDRGFFRTLSSYLFNILRKTILGINVTDSQCGLKVFYSDSVCVIKESKESGWFLDMEILARAENKNLSIVEVPVNWTEFRYLNRKSKLKVIRDGFGAILAMLRISRRIAKNNKVV